MEKYPVQLRLMAAGQDKPSASSILIDHSLDIGKQRRETLHFVQDTPFFYLAEESPWIGFSRHSDIRVLQRNIRFVRERHSGQGGLAPIVGGLR